MKRIYISPQIETLYTSRLMDDTDALNLGSTGGIHDGYGDGPQLGKEDDFEDEGDMQDPSFYDFSTVPQQKDIWN